MKDTVLPLLAKFAKVFGYVVLSALISLPFQEALRNWCMENISDPAIYMVSIAFINGLLAAISKVYKEHFGEDNVISKFI
jgi:uncharacterized membrane protein